MKSVVVEQFGGVEQLQIRETETPEPGQGQVRVRLTSIGMNHAELMARRGEYKLTSGDPPFTPGLEGGGIVDAVDEGLDAGEWMNKRVVLSADAPRRKEAGGSVGGDDGIHLAGTYRTHFLTTPDKLFMAPDNLADAHLGTLWLSFLTAWGCLIWKQKLKPGQYVGISAASSSVGLAASQIVKAHGGIPIGLSTTQRKVDLLKEMPEAAFEEIIVTHNEDRTMRPWHKHVLEVTKGHGIDVFFDAVGNGQYVDREIRALAQYGTIHIYGLLEKADRVDLGPLIRKHASIHGWLLGNLLMHGGDSVAEGYNEILQRVGDGTYKIRVAMEFPLDDVQRAHAEMEKGNHIGKLVLVP